ncbi:hypothetical protein [Francisella persica]|nr:hypothetical protein [Francisella persica]
MLDEMLPKDENHKQKSIRTTNYILIKVMREAQDVAYAALYLA